MELIRKKDLLKVLEEKYEDLTDESGCYVRTSNGNEWLSLSNVVELVHCCETFYEGADDELEQAERKIERLQKNIDELKIEYKRRLELMQKALMELTKGIDTVPNGKRVSKADFLAMHSAAVRDMDDDFENNDVYGYDFTVHWHGIYCNCGDGATPANHLIPGIEGCFEEDPTEY